MHSLKGVLVAALSSIASASLQVVPGGTWTASNGEHLQAHGAGIIKDGSLYYIIGEDKTDGSAFQNVNCYSSPDLVEWTYVGALLSETSSVPELGPNRVIERPKVLFNEKTGKYVLYMHVDSSNYGEAKVGVATGDTVCGKYEFLYSFQPLGFQSRDMGLFQDDDGAGYLLTEDRANGLRIDALSDDYLNVTTSTYLWSDSIEAPAMLKIDGTYYMFGSHLTGWDPNDNVYSTSTSLTSGWSAWKTFATAGSNTYTSQTNFILPVGSSAAIYLGDRWVSSNLMASTYVWLPLTISGTTVTMANADSWVPNLSSTSAEASVAKPSEASYEGEAAAYGGDARDVACSACSGGTAAGYVGGPDNGTVTFSNLRSDASARTTVRVRYVNGDSTPRYANVYVNGGAAQKLAFLPTGSSVSSSSLNTDLKSGSANTIVIEGFEDGWGPDVDELIIPLE
ncbi:carbohydrate-binding module family 35 protein [Jackrogersella minutella]|nr:carbohydrate-binding module family 35 protein [Jackrogersella minutella]